MMPAGGSPGGGAPDDRRDQWFPVRLTMRTGETTGGHPQYLGYEVWIQPDGSTAEIVGGRVLSAVQPGVFLGGDPGLTEYDLPVLALARLGPGAGGRLWELFGAERVAGSGSGADVSAGCDLETISFDVVTAVACDPSGGLTVTTRRVSITGCNLSVSQGDPPAAGSGSGGGGTAFATDCQGTGESMETHPDTSLSITDGPYSGVYALVWSATNPGAGPDGGAGWLLETTISAVPYRFFLFSAGPPGDVRWYLWVTNLNTSGTIVVIAASGACDPFGLAFPGADLGSADDVTVVIPP